jgi:hypothetical protein
LFTRIRSPTSSVGIIEPDGILNGSNRKERSTNTIRITGNSPAVQSSHQGWASRRSRAVQVLVVDLADALRRQLARGARCSVSAWAAARRRGRK